MTPSSDKSNTTDSPTWESGWEGHRRARLERWAKLPLSAKLDWLEEAHAIVRHMEAARKAMGEPLPKDR